MFVCACLGTEYKCLNRSKLFCRSNIESCTHWDFLTELSWDAFWCTVILWTQIWPEMFNFLWVQWSRMILSREDVQKLMDFQGQFDSGFGELSTSGTSGMKRRSWNGAQVYHQVRHVHYSKFDCIAEKPLLKEWYSKVQWTQATLFCWTTSSEFALRSDQIDGV